MYEYISVANLILKFQKLKTIRNPIENTHWRAPCQKEAEARLNANNTGYSIFRLQPE